MAEAAVKCPHCRSEAVVKYGKTRTVKERLRCQQREQGGRTFVGRDESSGCLPTVQQQIVGMTLNGSGIRDIARVLLGKTNAQQIDRKHLTLRTRIKRLARKTIGFSKAVFRHETVIDLFVNRYEFGTPI